MLDNLSHKNVFELQYDFAFGPRTSYKYWRPIKMIFAIASIVLKTQKTTFTSFIKYIQGVFSLARPLKSTNKLI